MTTEINLDDTPLATGTHKGETGGVLIDLRADFKSCGIVTGSLLENETDASSGAITALTESTVTCTLAGGSLNTWTLGDTYNIYRTATKDSEISRIYTDRMYGTKVFKRSELNKRGHFPEEEDLDAEKTHVFGPSQPLKGKGG
jgi:hypothetical protein